MKTKLLCLTLVVLIAIQLVSPAFALTTSTGQYSEKAIVSDTFNPDPAMLAFAQQKQYFAEQYYNALMNGNSEEATYYQQCFLQHSLSIVNETYQEMQRSVPSTYAISGFTQVPQQTFYYCGVATAKSILDSIGVSRTQSSLASNSYLHTTTDGTPWYLTYGTSYSDYPMASTLNAVQQEAFSICFTYIPAPCCTAGTNPLTETQCKSYVVSTVGNGYGVAACGISGPVGSASHLDGYPNTSIGHWFAIYGYINNGQYIRMADPAKSSAISWSDSIEAYEIINSSTLTAFVAQCGIVW